MTTIAVEVTTTFTVYIGHTRNSGAQTHTAVLGDHTYFWGAQLEAGIFPTSYIPTVASSAARSADVAAMTGVNFSRWFNPLEGTLYGSYRGPSGAQSSRAMSFNDGSTDNVIEVINSNSTGTAGNYGNVVVGGVAQATLSASTAYAQADYTAALGYKLDAFAFSRNGAVAATDSSGTVPSVTRLDIGTNAANSTLNGHIRRLSYYPTRLLVAPLQALSKA
jgi:hypothetical protein